MDRRTPRIGAVAFDIDGTLYPNTAMYLASWPVVARNLALFRAFGRARKAVRSERPLADLAARTVALTAGTLGADEAATERRIRELIYGEWESSLAKVRLRPGARETIEWLRDKGIHTAALSDFPVRRKLELLGIDDLWDTAFSSEETGYLKPNPEPFDRLVAEIGLPANRILYVGNSYRYDVMGARAVGLITAHVCRRRRNDSEADLSFHRFRRLREWLEPRLDATP